MRQPGYYPDYHCLDNADHWDLATRKIVLARLHPDLRLRFFSPAEATLLEAVVNRVLPQDDRDPDVRIPIVPLIDERLHQGRIEGYRYESMPPDRDAHRLGLVGINQIAHSLFARDFLALTPLQQDRVLLALHDAQPPADAPVWRRMPADRYWRLLVDDVVSVYYAHPYAWDEIGYGGPAYPRGYMRLDHGEPEPWESEEKRYPFEPPADSLSGDFTPLGSSQHGVKP